MKTKAEKHNETELYIPCKNSFMPRFNGRRAGCVFRWLPVAPCLFSVAVSRPFGGADRSLRVLLILYRGAAIQISCHLSKRRRVLLKTFGSGPVGPVRPSEASGPYAPGSASPHWFFRALTSFALQPSTLYSSACEHNQPHKFSSAILRGFSCDDSQA